jgi:N-acetylglucosamine malate deacetylase 1
MKLLHIHAHHDDYEWAAAGTFELWRRRLGPDFHARIVVCTDGQAGHHFRPRAETGALRQQEQAAAAAIAGVHYQQLTDHRGQQFREACVTQDAAFLAALWKAIRDFEPDYLFCPPLPVDPLAGVHPDHLTVAEGVRRVAYMINVPHAFTPEYPADETRSVPCKVPVIINVHDGYMAGANACDLAVNVEPAFEQLVDMTWCHQSQFCEWLPWVDRHNLRAPASKEDWAEQLCAAHGRRNREMGLTDAASAEFFRVTAWGAIPTAEKLVADFPGLIDPKPTLERLRQRLKRWSGD